MNCKKTLGLTLGGTAVGAAIGGKKGFESGIGLGIKIGIGTGVAIAMLGAALYKVGKEKYEKREREIETFEQKEIQT